MNTLEKGGRDYNQWSHQFLNVKSSAITFDNNSVSTLKQINKT